MFSPPNIIFIRNFDFERDGAPPRNKYMIVILQSGSDAVIAPLTTSKDFIPDEHKGPRCIIHAPSRLHCYSIPASIVVGKQGFAFEKDTYIQVQANLMKRDLASLKSKYESTGSAILKDELTDSEYSDLLYCIYKSQFVPRGIRRAMEPIIQELEQKKAS